MSKSSTKRQQYSSSVTVVDFRAPTPSKKQRVVLHPRNSNQEEYLYKLHQANTNILFAIGPAGTGKTMMAVQYGIKLFQEGKVDKIVITRPAVSVDEDLGFLPGTLNEKMAPWTRPIFDVIGEYYHAVEIEKMLLEGTIEISPLAYMRGRNLKNAYIIADECQLCTANQMKMLLTRLGENSKMVITGDLAQADRGSNNGLFDFIQRFKDYDGDRIDMIEFEHKDIERHPAVAQVLKLYGDC